MSAAQASSESTARARRSLSFERGTVIRAVVILVLFVFVIAALPKLVGSDWLTTFASASIYSIVALSFGILYGRVGMISLGQVALLSLGCWIGARLAYGTSIPFPLLLVVDGLITCAIGVLVGLPSLRLSGLYLALITLMFAGATTIVLSVIGFPERRRRLHGRLRHRGPDDEHPARSPAVDGGERHRLLPLHHRRHRAHVPARAGPRRRQARARVGLDPGERARCPCRGGQHHPLQDVGLRARVVHGGRRGLPARRPGRSAAGDHLPDAGLARRSRRPR